MRIFSDRVEAGRLLADEIEDRGLGGDDVVVLGLPRGGVVLAAQVASRIGSSLDVIVVRKLGVPWQPELAMGAIGEHGIRTIDWSVVEGAGVPTEEVDRVEQKEREELERRITAYRDTDGGVSLDGRIALIVDDGVATGSTARAACRVAHAMGARRVVLAIPVAPPETVRSLQDDADEVICLQSPSMFRAIGEFYQDFRQVTDDEVRLHLGGLAHD